MICHIYWRSPTEEGTLKETLARILKTEPLSEAVYMNHLPSKYNWIVVDLFLCRRNLGPRNSSS